MKTQFGSDHRHPYNQSFIPVSFILLDFVINLLTSFSKRLIFALQIVPRRHGLSLRGRYRTQHDDSGGVRLPSGL